MLAENSLPTPHDLWLLDLRVPTESIYTLAMVIVRFLGSQRPEGTAYVIGESGLTTVLHEVGYTLTDTRYVVAGETASYSSERIARAIRLLAAGARFIATNFDVTGSSEAGLIPATGKASVLISIASGVRLSFVSKPNPQMMSTALDAIDAHSEGSARIGDNTETDVVMGIGGLETIPLLSGVTRREDVERYSHGPSRIVGSVAEIAA